jgi:hypothetical protein
MLAAGMVAAMLAVTAFTLLAAEDAGDGTVLGDDLFGYTAISTPEELVKVGSTGDDTGDWPANGKYYLKNDIDLTGKDTNGADPGNMYPLSRSNDFTGTFDGNGKKILGVVIEVETDGWVYAGLFAQVYGGTIRNLSVQGSITATATGGSSGYVEGYAFAGGIAACLWADGSDAVIENCSFSGSVKATASATATTQNVIAKAYAGGITGHVYAMSWLMTATKCHSSGDIKSSASAETASGTFINSEAYAGGITGVIQSDTGDLQIESCYSSCDITTEARSAGGTGGNKWMAAGGIAGTALTSGGSVRILNCYSTGSMGVSSPSSAPAFIGGIIGDTTVISGTLTAKNCYFTGDAEAATGGDVCEGGIIGRAFKAAIEDCYFLDDDGTGPDICYTDSDLSACTGGPKTSAEMKAQSTYDNWNFDDIWEFADGKNNGYPVLQWTLAATGGGDGDGDGGPGGDSMMLYIVITIAFIVAIGILAYLFILRPKKKIK